MPEHHLPAWLNEASYWQPAHRPLSAWVEHAPFAFWVVEQTRPRSIVELGTHWGYSYFVFCEAVKRLGLPTRVHALDTWEGEDHAGRYGEEVFEYVAATTAADYADIGSMHRGYFSDRVSDFEDGSIDLLHIDGRHGYEDVREDFELYLPKLSDRAVVLFHDITEHQETFGVWRFWAEVAEQYPSFAFEHEHGLGVLGVGADLPEGMRAFFAAATGQPERVRADYEALGGAIRRYVDLETEATALREESARLRSELETTRAEAERLAADRQGLSNQLDAVHASSSWRLTRPVRWVSSSLRRSS